ncbi:hypothetical protein OG618_37455 (plasmid) [Kitasatospora sp. NBC_01246]|uniref:hypothetical protein n=1 Tax=Kitasatospora sp. NBC_01246 TaxID=2903570 RepID=UPI002E349D0F|nr:hypothetical protein [Kitasatospora sp. NBC_01246]
MPQEAVVRAVLATAGFEAHQGPDWRGGRPVPPRSGFVLAPGDRPGSLRLSYTDLDCSEAVEAGSHDRMREALNRAEGLAAEQVDTALARNVALRITAHRPVKPADLELLAAARTGHLVQHGTRWRGTDPDYTTALNCRLVPDLILTGWIERGPDGLAVLTDTGAFALNGADSGLV